MDATKENFIAEYRKALIETYGAAQPEKLDQWAANPAKLERFMASVRTTLFTGANTWNIDSPLVVRVWKLLGQKGKPSYKGLRALA